MKILGTDWREAAGEGVQGGPRLVAEQGGGLGCAGHSDIRASPVLTGPQGRGVPESIPDQVSPTSPPFPGGWGN